MNQLEHIEAIEKRLWSVADTLRANSNDVCNQYFLPIMGLVFLRHAYSRYLAVKDAIEANLSTRGGKTRSLTKEDFRQNSAIFLHPTPIFSWLLPRRVCRHSNLLRVMYIDFKIRETSASDFLRSH
jgi:type I restriction enzyme M protein